MKCFHLIQIDFPQNSYSGKFINGMRPCLRSVKIFDSGIETTDRFCLSASRMKKQRREWNEGNGWMENRVEKCFPSSRKRVCLLPHRSRHIDPFSLLFLPSPFSSQCPRPSRASLRFPLLPFSLTHPNFPLFPALHFRCAKVSNRI